LESVPVHQIEIEQVEVFPPVLTDDTDSINSGVQSDLEVIIETLTDVPVDTLVKTFVATSDIAKLVSSNTLSFNPLGSDVLTKTVMLLKNGLAYTDLKTPPGELEIPSSLESAVGTAWTFWRQDEETGAIYLGVDESGDELLLKGAEIDITPLTIDDIAGVHTKIRADIRGATQFTRWSDIVFHNDGTFEYAESTLSTTGGPDTYWHDSFESSFSYVSANRPVDGYDSASGETHTEPRKDMFGSYKLAEDGLSIDLNYADGSVKSRLIYKNDGYVHFGETFYKSRTEQKEQLANWRKKASSTPPNGLMLLNPAWLAVVADSIAAANDNRSSLSCPILALKSAPGGSKV